MGSVNQKVHLCALNLLSHMQKCITPVVDASFYEVAWSVLPLDRQNGNDFLYDFASF